MPRDRATQDPSGTPIRKPRLTETGLAKSLFGRDGDNSGLIRHAVVLSSRAALSVTATTARTAVMNLSATVKSRSDFGNIALKKRALFRSQAVPVYLLRRQARANNTGSNFPRTGVP